MSGKAIRIVFVEDRISDTHLQEIEKTLEKAGIDAELIPLQDSAGYMRQMQQGLPDIVLVCYREEGFAGLDCLRLHKLLAPQVPLVVLAPALGEELAIEVMREGACDIVFKHKLSRLPTAIAKVIEDAENTRQHPAQPLHPNQQHLLRDLLKMTPVGVFRCTPDKSCYFVNERYCEITGLKPEEALGTGWINAIHPGDRPALLREWYDKKGVVEEAKAIYRCQHPGTGEVVWVIGQSKSELDREGNVIGYLGTITDITRLKQTEEALKEKNDYLTKVNQELDSFVYSASHNLRAPLTSLMGLISMIRLETGRPEMLHRICDMMDTSLNRLDGFIRDIIYHSRNSRLALQFQQADAEALVQEVLDEFSFLEEYKQVDVQLKVHQEAPLYTDLSRLRIILRNLISNSIRYQNRHQPPWVVITIRITAKEVVFQIDDNGIGIRKEHQERVFDMFYRADEQRSGSGLGLYITREVVNKMGGNIMLSAEPFKGTNVRVVLPNQQAFDLTEQDPSGLMSMGEDN